MTSLATHRRRARILFTLGVLVATASYNPAHGQDLGQLSANPYAPNSTANPYSPAGSPYSATSEHSADSINNPYGAGSKYRSDSPRNPYGVGMKIVAGGQEGGDDDAASPPDSPTFLPKPLPALNAPTEEVDPSD